MRGSQIVLLSLMVLYALYIVRLRSTLSDRLIYLGLAVVGAVLVLRPDWTNDLAARLSIGRGADLMFYLFVVFSLFHFAATAATIRRMQRDLGDLARALALLTPGAAAPPARASGAASPRTP
jgi:hypothetical protein